ncbi:MAG TPA: hypothetical protein VMC79_13205 [Rectinemataceae bacterium]|nr:hypothetical protein [Rectinemataceae bacterium]
MNFIAVFSVFCTFIAAPAIVFSFIYFTRRGKNQVEMQRLKKEMLELEVDREELHLKVLVEENKKYDRMIGERQEYSN